MSYLHVGGVPPFILAVPLECMLCHQPTLLLSPPTMIEVMPLHWRIMQVCDPCWQAIAWVQSGYRVSPVPQPVHPLLLTDRQVTQISPPPLPNQMVRFAQFPPPQFQTREQMAGPNIQYRQPRPHAQWEHSAAFSFSPTDFPSLQPQAQKEQAAASLSSRQGGERTVLPAPSYRQIAVPPQESMVEQRQVQVKAPRASFYTRSTSTTALLQSPIPSPHLRQTSPDYRSSGPHAMPQAEAQEEDRVLVETEHQETVELLLGNLLKTSTPEVGRTEDQSSLDQELQEALYLGQEDDALRILKAGIASVSMATLHWSVHCTAFWGKGRVMEALLSRSHLVPQNLLEQALRIAIVYGNEGVVKILLSKMIIDERSLYVKLAKESGQDQLAQWLERRTPYHTRDFVLSVENVRGLNATHVLQPAQRGGLLYKAIIDRQPLAVIEVLVQGGPCRFFDVIKALSDVRKYYSADQVGPVSALLQNLKQTMIAQHKSSGPASWELPTLSPPKGCSQSPGYQKHGCYQQWIRLGDIETLKKHLSWRDELLAPHQQRELIWEVVICSQERPSKEQMISSLLRHQALLPQDISQVIVDICGYTRLPQEDRFHLVQCILQKHPFTLSQIGKLIQILGQITTMDRTNTTDLQDVLVKRFESQRQQVLFIDQWEEFDHAASDGDLWTLHEFICQKSSISNHKDLANQAARMTAQHQQWEACQKICDTYAEELSSDTISTIRIAATEANYTLPNLFFGKK